MPVQETHKVSRLGIDLIAGFEGCKLTAYPDASPRRIPTIGFGHTGAGVMLGQRINQERADELLVHDLATSEDIINRAVHVPLTQCQFNALVSLVFNTGPGAPGQKDGIVWLRELDAHGQPQHSTLLRKLNAGDYAGASLQFLNWAHAGDEVLPGLVRRRAAERAMFGVPTPDSGASPTVWPVSSSTDLHSW